MAQETESERIARINASQLSSRDRNTPLKANVKAKSRQQAAPQASLITELFRLLPSWFRDISVGVGVGLIPAILIVIFLPDAFKLLSIVVLVIAGGVGYMRGDAPNN